MKPACVLVGVMGAGKTTVGQLVAARLGTTFRDSDADIEAAEGKPISEFFIVEGEDYFRALEEKVVIGALDSFDGVLALGGGAILSERTRAALAGHTVVFLSVGLADAVSRVGLGTGRPLLALNPRATLKYLMEQRQPLYDEVARFTVATDGRAPEDVADEIVALLKS